jgi:hypothetical protein
MKFALLCESHRTARLKKQQNAQFEALLLYYL